MLKDGYLVKRILPFVLVLIVLFLGAPRQACFCAELSNQPIAKHGCCKKEKQSDCCSATPAISTCKSCCGMAAKYYPSLASSFAMQSQSESLSLIRFGLGFISYFKTCIESSRLANPNRAPPNLVGMGTNKTYLFKRTFLI